MGVYFGKERPLLNFLKKKRLWVFICEHACGNTCMRRALRGKKDEKKKQNKTKQNKNKQKQNKNKTKHMIS